MASSLQALCCLFIASLFISSIAVAQPPLPPTSLSSAVEALANSGYSAMSLTLLLIGDTLPISSDTDATLTIFSPSDKAFSKMSEPSMDHLLLHFTPKFLSQKSLISLPIGSIIPTLSHSEDLIVTSNGNRMVSINNVRVSESPIFDDGSVIIYGIEDFLGTNFIASPIERESAKSSTSSSGMVSFLDLQLMGFVYPGSLTEEMLRWSLFAPFVRR